MLNDPFLRYPGDRAERRSPLQCTWSVSFLLLATVVFVTLLEGLLDESLFTRLTMRSRFNNEGALQNAPVAVGARGGGGGGSGGGGGGGTSATHGRLRSPLPSLPPARSRNRTAVCMTGTIRSLAHPLVYSSVKTNLLDRLGDYQTFWITEVKGAIKEGMVDPLIIRQEEIEWIKEIYNTASFELYNYTEAENRGFLKGVNCTWHNRSLTAFKAYNSLQKVLSALYMCYERVQAYEAKHNMRFDFVAKFRPDVAVFAPIEAVETLDPRSVHVSAYSMASINDYFFLLHRTHSDAFFLHTFDMYMQCNERFFELMPKYITENTWYTSMTMEKVPFTRHDWPLVLISEFEGAQCQRLEKNPLRHKQCKLYGFATLRTRRWQKTWDEFWEDYHALEKHTLNVTRLIQTV